MIFFFFILGSAEEQKRFLDLAKKIVHSRIPSEYDKNFENMEKFIEQNSIRKKHLGHMMEWWNMRRYVCRFQYQ